MRLPCDENTPPTLAVDVVTGGFYRGEHQLVLADLLATMRDAAGPDENIDPRFLSETDAYAFGTGLHEQAAHCAVELRPYYVIGEDDRAEVSSLQVVPACMAKLDAGLEDAYHRRAPVMLSDVTKYDSDKNKELAADADFEPDGLFDAVAANHHDRFDPTYRTAVNGIALWMAHGVLAMPPAPDALATIQMAERAANAALKTGASLGELANDAQSLADEVVQTLVMDRTDGRRPRQDLDRSIAIEYGAPCPDLHCRVRNKWRYRNVYRAAMNPHCDFERKPRLAAFAARVAADLEHGNFPLGIAPHHAADIVRWQPTASAAPIEATSAATIDWDRATGTGKRADAAIERALGDESLPVDSLHLRERMRAAGTPIPDGFDSMHEFGFGAVFLTVADDRRTVASVVVATSPPLHRAEILKVNGAEWMPVDGDTSLWTCQNPAQFNHAIGDIGGTTLSIETESHEREHDRARRERAKLPEEVRVAAELDRMSQALPADTDEDLLNRKIANLGPDGNMLLMANRDVPINARIVLPDSKGLEQGDLVPVTIGLVTTNWRATNDNAERMVLTPTSPAALSPALTEGCNCSVHLGENTPDVRPLRFDPYDKKQRESLREKLVSTRSQVRRARQAVRSGTELDR